MTRLCCLMDCFKYFVKKIFLLLVVSLHLCSAVTHSLQYITTAVTPGAQLPEYTVVGQVDGEQFVYYDSQIKKMIPKTDWIKNIDADDPDYWNTQTLSQEGAEEVFKANINILMQRFNQTKGFHTLQRLSGCELDDDGTKRGYFQFGFDGEDFIILDLKTETWTAAVSQAVITKVKWEGTPVDAHFRKNYLENECIEWLKKYVGYGRDTLERKVRPEVSVFQKDSSSPVVCHATGFFPKAVMISWQKNGEDLNEDVELRETLPNQDGTFQKRSILTLSPEELKNNKYTCVVQHSSPDIWFPPNISLPGGRDNFTHYGSIVAAFILILILTCCGMACIFKRRRRSR